MGKIKIAIDGPAGSGKTTTAKLVAERLNYIYIDTGAMYRAVTLAWLKTNKPLEESVICKLMKEIKIYLQQTESGQSTFLDGVNVTDAIRSPEVTANVSPVSAIQCVRDKLVTMQRELGKNGGAVLEGRDIGTIVFPDAELKIFLNASVETRALRRAKELKEKGMEFSVEEIKAQITERDQYDSTRSISPLKKAKDSIEIDTSNLTIEQQCEKIIELVNQIIKK
jgi:CMP/dCMP kinase